MARTLVLLRHGQSQWNLENRFTGWVDVPLSPAGEKEALEAGRLMTAEGFTFDVIHTSVLKRAIKTMWIVTEQMDQMWVPVFRSFRLNERHYGALQGLNKAETAAKHGEAQVKLWRRSYDIPPPPMDKSHPDWPGRDRRYADVAPGELPVGESLKDTVARVLPLWNDAITRDLRAGKRVLIVAHGNSMRGLVKHLDGMSDAEIVDLNIPTGVPLVYELDDELRPRGHHYLGDAAAVAAAAEAVAKQGSAK